MSARVPLAFGYPAMARTVKVRVSMCGCMGVRKWFQPLCTSSCKQVVCLGASAQAALPACRLLCLYSDQACVCVSTATDTKAGHCTTYH